jgi:hypothetical protein
MGGGGGRAYEAVPGPGREGSDVLEKTLASGSVDVSSGGVRGVGLGGGTKGTAMEYFVLWSSMTRSRCAISSTEEGQGSVGVHEQRVVEKTKGEHTNRIGMDLL